MSREGAEIKVIEGTFVAPASARFGIVAARFNGFIVERLVEGALDALRRHGVGDDRIVIVRVPGAWELPGACALLAKSEKLDALIALGAVIRGATAHFEHVAGGAVQGIADVSRKTSVPIALGVLTTDTIEQAIERAGTKSGNKGFDAALSALEMVSLEQALTEANF